VSKQKHYLRIHRESPPDAPGEPADSSSLASLCRDFAKVTGWPLRFVPGGALKTLPDPLWSAPVAPGVGTSLGHLAIERAAAKPRVPLGEAIEMAATLAQTLGELSQAREALREREAELAAGVPVVGHRDEEAHLAARLEAVLKAGAESIGCQAAALYLLDAATTELKMRSCHGLPATKLVEPARPLKGAMADLEALTGSAVALEDDALHEFWNVPEPCGSAVCVPVSSPTTLLGTLWFFCREPREFSDQETNQAEIIAGRIAADLEREMLLTAGAESRQLQRQLHEAGRLQENQLPRVAPLLDRWQMAGWAEQKHDVGGDFFDWSVLAEGQVALLLGDALERGVPAALAAASLRATLRAHAEYGAPAGEVLGRVSRSLWTGSAGDLFAAAFFAKLDPHTGQLEYAHAGRLGAIVLYEGGWRSLAGDAVPLAMRPDLHYATAETVLEPGAALIVYSDGVRDALDHMGRPLGEGLLAKALLPHLDAPAKELVDRVRDALEAHAADSNLDDRAVLIARHLRD
jgi:serine phosphatase RsbU (regulator of sigma subunit)